nr:hypothetical protein [uncultured Prevotella sp.]
MKQNKIKLGYQKPQTEIMSINSESSILNTSFPGQHNPGRRRTGPTANNAKQELEWLEVGDETSASNGHTSLWED